MIGRILNILLNQRAKIKLRNKITFGKKSKVEFYKIYAKEESNIVIGNNSMIQCKMFFEQKKGKIEIGDRTFIGDSLLVCADNLKIGSDVLIAWGCTIVDHNSHSIYWEERKDDVVNWMKGIKIWDKVKIAPIIIHDKVWIGFDSVIMKGVEIGEGSVVAAKSVVTKNVPPNTIVAGNPAKVIKYLQ